MRKLKSKWNGWLCCVIQNLLLALESRTAFWDSVEQKSVSKWIEERGCNGVILSVQTVNNVDWNLTKPIWRKRKKENQTQIPREKEDKEMEEKKTRRVGKGRSREQDIVDYLSCSSLITKEGHPLPTLTPSFTRRRISCFASEYMWASPIDSRSNDLFDPAP